MKIIRYRTITYLISALLFAISVAAFSLWGLKLGIDFTGGTLMEIEYSLKRPAGGEARPAGRPSPERVREALEKAGVSGVVIQQTGERGFLIRAAEISEDLHQRSLSELRTTGELVEKRFDSIGPTIGQELARRSMWAILLVILLIVSYIAFAFRKVSEPVASWKYGVATVAALIHDVAIPVGIFSVLGHFYGVEVNTLFVTALLTILGFSVHDTIVVFDRIRENLKNARRSESFDTVVGQSISQTVTRSINTSLTVLLVLSAVYLFGGESIQTFALTLIVGIAFGTYSSIFLASPLLVTWNSFSNRK